MEQALLGQVEKFVAGEKGGIRLDLYAPKHTDPCCVLVFGHGTGLHGSPVERGMSYAPFLKELAVRNIAVIAFTLPGHGFSSLGKNGHWELTDYGLCSSASLEWAKELGWEGLPVVYMGWSQGGIGGTLVASSLGNAFSGYILHNAGRGQDAEMREFTLYSHPNRGIDLLLRSCYWVQRIVLLGVVARLWPGLRLPTSLYLPLKKIFEGDKEEVRAWHQDPLAVRWYTLRAVRSLLTRVGDLSTVTVPVLVLFPEHDMSSLSYQEKMTGLFPNGVLRVIPEAGHSMIRNKPSQLADLVTEFLTHIK